MNEKTEPINGYECIFQTYGYISYPLGTNIFIKIAKLSYELFEDESYQYLFEPYYDVLDALGDLVSIPGINTDLRKDKYYRVNMVPVFISERTFPSTRVEAKKLLREKGLNYYNPMLWLIDSEYKYSGDSLLLKSESFFENLKIINDSKNIYRHILHVLQSIGRRKRFLIGDLEVNNDNRELVTKLYLNQYRKVESSYYNNPKKPLGRNKIEIPFVQMKEVVNLYEHQIITLEEAMERLNIKSESTFYRRLREYRSKINE